VNRLNAELLKSFKDSRNAQDQRAGLRDRAVPARGACGAYRGRIEEWAEVAEAVDVKPD
jgi:hypothetical protein